jgi:hypothetical protein
MGNPNYHEGDKIMKRMLILLVTLALLFSGCGGSNPEAKITSVKYVEKINTGGTFYSFEGKDNIQITLDF